MAAPKPQKGTFQPTPVVAAVFGIGMILLANILEGGHTRSLLQPSAAMIVVGGSFAATWLSSTPAEIKALRLALVRTLFWKSANRRKVLDTILRVANVARRSGTLAVEEMLPTIEDTFLRRGLQALVDGWTPAEIQKLLELEMEIDEAHATTAGKLLESAGGYSPTFGIIGAVVGLIHVMNNLTDPSKLGSGIAVAFVATIYGLVFANLVALPLGARMKKMAKDDVELRSMIVVGLELVASGANPRKVEDMLAPWVAGTKPAAAQGEPPLKEVA